MTDAHENPHHARRWLVLALLGIAQLMVVLDATIVNIALPSAQKALAFSNDNRQWIITAYALAFGSLLLLGGRLSDLFGRKWTFIAGLLGFAVASAIGGAAQSFGVLVGARALQGAFGALLAPAALSLLSTTFTDPSERGKAFGVFGAIAGSGAAIGLLLGGILTSYLSWRFCLYVNLLFAIPTALAALSLLHNVANPAKPRLDVLGILTASSGLFGLVYGFSNAETHGWGAPLTGGMLAAGVVLISIFVWLQQRTEHPLLPLRVVADRDRGGSYLAVGIAGAGIFGVFLFLTYYLQQVVGYSPVRTGLAFLPLSAAIMSSASFTTARVLPRTGPKPLVTTGMALASVAMVLLTGIGPDTAYASHVLPSLLLLGAGFGLIIAPSMATATFGVAPVDAGAASAMVSTAQQVGGSIGTAFLSTIAAGATSGFTPGPGQAGRQALVGAAIHGYTTAFWWSAAIFAVGAVVCGSLLRRGPQGAAAPVTVGGAEPALAQ
jgi:EmrB/QacA subfamily drug resistance transporter